MHESDGANRNLADGLPADSPLWDVWEAIRGFYPGATTNWGPEPPLIWAHVLNEMSMDQLANGVRNLVHHRDQKGGNEFPPNAGQFRDLCLSNFNWRERAHKPFDELPALENKTLKEKQRTERMDALKKLREEVGL